MQVVANDRSEHRILKKLIDAVFFLFALGLFGHSIYQVIMHFKELSTLDTFRDFILSPLLAIWMLPYIYMLSIHLAYQGYYMGLSSAISNSELAKYAKWQGTIKFNLDIAGFGRWMKRLFTHPVTSKQDIIDSIKEIKRLQKVERNPPMVAADLGWSPYIAKDFLKDKGFETGYYSNICDDEWGASSNYIELIGGLNNISYYIEGDERVVKKLTLALNVHQLERDEEAIDPFLEFASALYNMAFKQRLPKAIEEAIRNRQSQKIDTQKSTLFIKRDDWRNSYGLTFYIQYK